MASFAKDPLPHNEQKNRSEVVFRDGSMGQFAVAGSCNGTFVDGATDTTEVLREVSFCA